MQNEKLKPFDFEEAKKHPERVRWADGRRLEADPLFVEDIVVIRCSQLLGKRADAFGPSAQHVLRLAVVPEKTQFVLSVPFPSEPGLYVHRKGGAAGSRHNRFPASKVHDVEFDKTTGILTITHDA